MKMRLYSRKRTAKVAMMVKLIVTPRTAAGSAWPERPMLASVWVRRGVSVFADDLLRPSQGNEGNGFSERQMISGCAGLEHRCAGMGSQSCTEGKARREAMLQDAGEMFDRDGVVLLCCAATLWRLLVLSFRVFL